MVRYSLKFISAAFIAISFAAHADIAQTLDQLRFAKRTVYQQALSGKPDLAQLDKDLDLVSKIVTKLLSDSALTEVQRAEAYSTHIQCYWVGTFFGGAKYATKLREIKNEIVRELPGSDTAALAEFAVIQYEMQDQTLAEFSKSLGNFVKTYPKHSEQAGQVASGYVVQVFEKTGSKQASLDAYEELVKLLPDDEGLLTTGLAVEVSGLSAKKMLDVITAFHAKHNLILAVDKVASDAMETIQKKEGKAIAIQFGQDILKICPHARTVKELIASMNLLGKPADLSGPLFGDTKNFDISEYKGKVVIVDFFASWCGPCRAAAPKLAAMLDKYSNDGLRIVGYSLDDSPEDLEKYLTGFEQELKKDKLPHWPTVHQPDAAVREKFASRYGVKSIPSFFIIDADGNIASGKLSFAELEAAVRQALGK